MSDKVLPYEKEGDKKEQVRRMFDNIAGHYDFLNDFLSLGYGTRWRNKAIKRLLRGGFMPSSVLDVASGTGDFALGIYGKLNGNVKIVGIDLSEQMLAKAKLKAGDKNIEFLVADAEKMPFPDGSFDAVSCSYGIRNFDNPVKGLSEFYRVLSPGGRAVIIELSDPEHKGLKNLFRFYFRYILPIFGGTISGDAAAYRYLPKSVASFPCGVRFSQMMELAGFSNCSYKELMGGIATIYFGEKFS